jgi:hypothetical protein
MQETTCPGAKRSSAKTKGADGAVLRRLCAQRPRAAQVDVGPFAWCRRGPERLLRVSLRELPTSERLQLVALGYGMNCSAMASMWPARTVSQNGSYQR